MYRTRTLFYLISVQLLLIKPAFTTDTNHLEYCETKTGGICVSTEKCPEKYPILSPRRCFFKSPEPTICCIAKINENTIVRKSRISMEKCRTIYSKPTPIRVTREVLQTTVAGGLKTAPGEFPHMVSLGWTQSPGNIIWRCGGSLISENFVLTAAHCISRTGSYPDIIRIGAYDLRNTSTKELPNDFSVDNVIFHPNYRRRSRYHDIALIKLNQTITIKSNIRPACLWQEFKINSTEATITGYGHVEYGGKSSDSLLKANLTLVDNEICKQRYRKDSTLANGILGSQLCAGDPDAIKDACQGDSGGPLQLQINNEKQIVFYVIGVTSFGKACAVTTPGVYTRVSHYLNWIESIVWPENEK